jgi:hypothetical protein
MSSESSEYIPAQAFALPCARASFTANRLPRWPPSPARALPGRSAESRPGYDLTQL